MANKLFESNWSATKEALLDGLTGNRRKTLDVIYENTRREVGRSFLGESATAGATQSGNIAVLNKVMLPLIRRVMPTVIANEIMGIQPMTSSVGQIHTLRVRYANTAGGVSAGTEALGPFEIAKAYSGNESTTAPGAASTARLEGVAGNKMSIQIMKETVEAKTRKLSARWTFEAAQDANAIHGIDIEAEIMQTIAQEITVEIDQEMLYNLSSLVPVAPVTFNQAAVSGTATYVGDEMAALATMINQQANLIAARTRRGSANWAVVSPTALTILQSATTSAFARTTEGTFEAPTNTKFVGTLNGVMRVYVNQFASDSDPVLIGYKGATETDAAAFFCPYIPLQSIGPVMDPSTMEPVVSFMSRYGYLALTNSANSFGNAADYLSKVGINAATLRFY